MNYKFRLAFSIGRQQPTFFFHCRRRRSRPPHLQPPGLGVHGEAGPRGHQGEPGVLAAAGQVDGDQLAAGGVRPAEVQPRRPQVRGLPQQGRLSGGEEV